MINLLNNMIWHFYRVEGNCGGLPGVLPRDFFLDVADC